MEARQEDMMAVMANAADGLPKPAATLVDRAHTAVAPAKDTAIDSAVTLPSVPFVLCAKSPTLADHSLQILTGSITSLLYT